MLEMAVRCILNNRKQIKDYTLVQILAFFWLCMYLNDNIYIEKFQILLTIRSVTLIFLILGVMVLAGYLLWVHKNGICIQENSCSFIYLGMIPLTLVLVFCSCCQNNIIVIITVFSMAYIVMLGIVNAKKMLMKHVGRKQSHYYRLLYVNKIIKVASFGGFLIILNVFVFENILPQKKAVTSLNNINEEKNIFRKEEMVRDFDEKNWQRLSKKKRLQLLQKIADYATKKYLGCCNVTVQQAITQDKDTWGWFENTMPEFVFVSSNLLEEGTVHDLAYTVLHEVYHHYEYECISAFNFNDSGSELYYFQKLKAWSENFKNYRNADKFGYEAYKNQQIEKDANEFSERITKEILK